MRPEERVELARLLPSPGDPVLPNDRHDLLKDHLMQELTLDVTGPAASHGPRQRPARGRRFAMIAVPLATATAVAAAVLGFGVGGFGSPDTDPEAVDLLNRIATVSAAREPVSVRDDQYLYIRTEGSVKITDKDVRKYREKRWTAVDGTRPGLARTTFLNGRSTGPRDPLQGMTKGTHDMTLNIDPNSSTLREVERLPTDPDALLKEIYADTGGEGRHGEALEKIGEMLDEATLLPEVGAALYRAAAKIPGVTVADNAKDRAGRSGIGLSFEDHDEHHVWVFDRKTLDYLGSESSALLDVGVVDKIGDQPGS